MSKASCIDGIPGPMLNAAAVRATIKRLCRPALLATLLCSGAAQARSEEEEWVFPGKDFEIASFVGITLGGEFENPNTRRDRDVNDAPSIGIILDYVAYEPGTYYELFYSHQSTDVQGPTELDLDIQHIHIGGKVEYLWDERTVVPFAAAGVGITVLSPDRTDFDDETDFSLSLAGGLRIPLSDRIGLRLEARALVTFLNSDSSIFCFGIGTCDIRTSSDTFVQFTAGIGVTAGF
jgi:hypothetical protein